VTPPHAPTHASVRPSHVLIFLHWPLVNEKSAKLHDASVRQASAQSSALASSLELSVRVSYVLAPPTPEHVQMLLPELHDEPPWNAYGLDAPTGGVSIAQVCGQPAASLSTHMPAASVHPPLLASETGGDEGASDIAVWE
jgi:hypothetical protein